jgi:hypothetical protein
MAAQPSEEVMDEYGARMRTSRRGKRSSGFPQMHEKVPASGQRMPMLTSSRSRALARGEMLVKALDQRVVEFMQRDALSIQPVTKMCSRVNLVPHRGGLELCFLESCCVGVHEWRSTSSSEPRTDIRIREQYLQHDGLLAGRRPSALEIYAVLLEARWHAMS